MAKSLAEQSTSRGWSPNKELDSIHPKLYAVELGHLLTKTSSTSRHAVENRVIYVGCKSWVSPCPHGRVPQGAGPLYSCTDVCTVRSYTALTIGQCDWLTHTDHGQPVLPCSPMWGLWRGFVLFPAGAVKFRKQHITCLRGRRGCWSNTAREVTACTDINPGWSQIIFLLQWLFLTLEKKTWISVYSWFLLGEQQLSQENGSGELGTSKYTKVSLIVWWH